MKFRCDNCSAKYQIADEKISGKTLRMKCRKCTHDIVVKGDKASVELEQALSQARETPAADEHRSETPQPAQWHVAIDDVPVGPMKFEELEKKIASGAVTGESLVWREGMEAWVPASEVEELQDAIRARPAPPALPKPAVPAPVGRPSGRRSSHSPRGSQAPTIGTVIPFRGSSGGAAAATATAFDEDEATVIAPSPGVETPLPDDDGLPSLIPGAMLSSMPAPAPTTSSEEAPLGAISGEVARTEEQAVTDFHAPSFEASAPGSLSSPSIAPVKSRRSLPVGAWIAIAGSTAFGVMLAILVANNWLNPSERVVIVQEPAPAPDVETVAEPEGETPTEADVAAEETAEPEPDEAEPAETTTGPAPRTPTREELLAAARERAAAEQAAANNQAQPPRTEAQSNQTARSTTAPPAFEEEPDLSRIHIPGQRGTQTGPTGEGLTTEQLGRVVSQNRPSLQRCYERAIRGQSNPPRVRVDVTLTVGAGGRVTAVSTSANNSVAGLESCIEGAARRWLFPAAGAASQTRFPVVFQAGS